MNCEVEICMSQVLSDMQSQEYKTNKGSWGKWVIIDLFWVLVQYPFPSEFRSKISIPLLCEYGSKSPHQSYFESKSPLALWLLGQKCQISFPMSPPSHNVNDRLTLLTRCFNSIQWICSRRIRLVGMCTGSWSTWVWSLTPDYTISLRDMRPEPLNLKAVLYCQPGLHSFTCY